MSKFKPGEMVKVVSSTWCPTHKTRALVGEVCEVEEHYSYSGTYSVYNHDKSDSWYFNESDLIKENDLEEMKYKKGEVLVDDEGNTRKVLEVLGCLYFTSQFDDFGKSGNTVTQEELDEYGWKLQSPKDTLEINGKLYSKSDVEDRIKELEPIEGDDE